MNNSYNNPHNFPTVEQVHQQFIDSTKNRVNYSNGSFTKVTGNFSLKDIALLNEMEQPNISQQRYNTNSRRNNY